MDHPEKEALGGEIVPVVVIGENHSLAHARTQCLTHTHTRAHTYRFKSGSPGLSSFFKDVYLLKSGLC